VTPAKLLMRQSAETVIPTPVIILPRQDSSVNKKTKGDIAVNYMISVDASSINELSKILMESCRAKGIRINKVQTTLVLMEVISKAKASGLFTPEEDRN